MTDALVLQGVTKRFGTFTAVDNLSLTVPSGCIYGFLGQNGAGKTTTIRMV
ncbi:MAG: ATP-binding cassette domain-containing protein, partial [Planctomycetes bacterium]|nr:ATP-binding cassette domain-containing protein [Planctomycetota bacterium]